jgi:hypothetical protein
MLPDDKGVGDGCTIKTDRMCGWEPAGALKEAGIPFRPAVGAIFLWADLRAGLTEATWEVCLGQWYP